MMQAEFYDQLLDQIGAGEAQSALTHLSGMLDGAAMDEALFAEARMSLQSHPLFTLIGSHLNLVTDWRRWCCTSGEDDLLSSTKRALRGAMQAMPLYRAMRERSGHASQLMRLACDDNKRVCAIGEGDTALMHPAACHYAAPDDLSAQPVLYDLIYAPDMAFQLDAADLGRAVASLGFRLAPLGVIVITSLTPGHLGTGWRRACLGWEAHCHSEAVLRAVAKAAGHSIYLYHDASNCLFWGEITAKQGIQHEL